MRSSQASILLSMLVCSLVPTALGQDQNAPTAATFVVGSSGCPLPSEVASETIRLTPPDRRPLYFSHVRIHVDDLGERYQVRVFDPRLRVEKTYVDPARDCAHRARFAAVLVILTLMPPQIALEPTELEPEVAIAPSKTSDESGNQPQITPDPVQQHKAQPQSDPLARVSVGASLRWAPRLFDAVSATDLGVILRCSIGRGALAGFMSLGYAPESQFYLMGIAGKVQRLPAAVGLEWRTRPSKFELASELGVVAVFERIRGDGLARAQADSAVEVGARLGGTVSYGQGLIVPFGGIHFDVYPVPRQIAAAPRGRLGSTPVIEFTTSIGGRIRF